VDGALLYFNTEYVRENFMKMLKQCGEEEVRLAIFYMGTSPAIDLAGAELLTELHESLKAKGIRMRLAEAHGNVRDALRRAGFEKVYGTLEANQTVSQVLTSEGDAALEMAGMGTKGT